MSDQGSAETYGNDTSTGMKMTIKLVQKKFSLVENVDTAVFHKWADSVGKTDKPAADRAADEAKSDPTSVHIPSRLLILDARPEEEYNVSHIKSAQRVNPDASDVRDTLTALRKEDADTTVVCYCSVGYRSSLYAQAMNKELEKDQELQSRVSVFNLEGSLFKWANEKRPIIDSSGNITKQVHPYNALFKLLLKKH